MTSTRLLRCLGHLLGYAAFLLIHGALDDAAATGLLVNFHGATLPRGWNRTYPNLMTMEAGRGYEFLTFEQQNTDQEPTYCAMLPFARNTVGPQRINSVK